MEENKENPLKKQPKIFIIGAGPAGSVTTTKRVEEILETQKIKGVEVVVLDSKESFAKELEGVDISTAKPLNELIGPPPIVIKNYRSMEMLEEIQKYQININEVNNPWPSPKGRKGKKRY